VSQISVLLYYIRLTISISGFTSAAMMSGPGGSNGSMSMGPSQSGSTSVGGSSAAAPSAAAPSGAVGNTAMTDSFTFLRGGWETNSNGIVNFNTIYPGYCMLPIPVPFSYLPGFFADTGRAIHIHTMVHQNITYNSNGTYSSRSGSLLHVVSRAIFM
jgi:hypothetical protein